MAEDRLKGSKINKNGYGIIPKLVMQDSNLSIATKAVYAYFCSYAGTGDCCFPTRKKICNDLKISSDSLSKYLKQLVENGYLIIEQEKENGRFSHNVYTLPDTKLPCPKISDTENSDTENFGNDKMDTNNNNYKINNSNNNKINKINKDKKKERKTTGYDEILSSVADNDLRDLYYEFIKMRKLIKSPMTDRALTTLINKVNTLEPNSTDRQKQLLENAIINNWKSVYPLKDDKKQKYNTNYEEDDLSDLF